MVLKLQQHDHRLQELGDFLRTRRARLTPEEVGLPKGTRRKTPGLRRAEVAQLVGVSVDWYTWLEQGRAIKPSTQVLERLVQTLRLDAHERTHLWAWVANSDVMKSYAQWCEAHGYVPKKAKGLAQSLAAHGLEVGVRQWVSTGPGIRTKTRGVRGLRVQDCSQASNTSGDRLS